MLNGPASSKFSCRNSHNHTKQPTSRKVSSCYFINRTCKWFETKNEREEKIPLEVYESLRCERNLFQTPKRRDDGRAARPWRTMCAILQDSQGTRAQRTCCSKLLINARYQHQQLLIMRKESPYFLCNYFWHGSPRGVSRLRLAAQCDNNPRLPEIHNVGEKEGLRKGEGQLETLVMVIALWRADVHISAASVKFPSTWL